MWQFLNLNVNFMNVEHITPLPKKSWRICKYTILLNVCKIVKYVCVWNSRIYFHCSIVSWKKLYACSAYCNFENIYLYSYIICSVSHALLSVFGVYCYYVPYEACFQICVTLHSCCTDTITHFSISLVSIDFSTTTHSQSLFLTFISSILHDFI